MIIDKVLPYWTEQEIQRVQEIQREEDLLLAELNAAVNPAPGGQSSVPKQFFEKWNPKWQALVDENREIFEAVERRYIKAHSKKEIIADIEEIVDAITKADFQELIKNRLTDIARLEKRGTREEGIARVRPLAVENFENCYSFILSHLRVQFNALAQEEELLDRARNIIGKRVALWYIDTQPAFVKMAHGKATDAFAFMSGKNAEIDRVTGNGTVDKYGVQLAVLKLRDLQATLGVSTDKLLSTAIARFTQQNDFSRAGTPKREVTIPLMEYAQLLGYEVMERDTSTPEEAEREKRRANDQLNNARRAIKNDLLLLQASTLRWEETIKGKARDFDSISLVTRVQIRNGEIKIAFSPELAAYLVERGLITQYPTKLLRISGRKPTAYYIGRKLTEHYNIDNNQVKGTNDRISIPALLAATDLPSYEEVQKTDRGHWIGRIKDPLERALDELTQEGILRDWKYTHARGIDLTDDEAYNLTSYQDFAALYLRFTPEDKVDHADRIKAKQEARAAREERARKRNAQRKSGKKGQTKKDA